MLRWQEWEKWKVSTTYSFHFPIEWENMPQIPGTEEILQVNDSLLNEGWFPDGTSAISRPSLPSPPNITTVFQWCHVSCSLLNVCVEAASLVVIDFFKGHIMLWWNLNIHNEDIQFFPRKICFKKEAHSYCLKKKKKKRKRSQNLA